MLQQGHATSTASLAPWCCGRCLRSKSCGSRMVEGRRIGPSVVTMAHGGFAVFAFTHSKTGPDRIVLYRPIIPASTNLREAQKGPAAGMMPALILVFTTPSPKRRTYRSGLLLQNRSHGLVWPLIWNMYTPTITLY